MTKNTLFWYEQHGRRFYEATHHLTPFFLEPLLDHLLPGCRVLDVGCGSGRDLLWFRQKGFAATGFELSSTLARLAREKSGCPVVEGDFTLYDFATLATDAIVLSGSLVHLPHPALSTVLKRILVSLKPSTDAKGIVYLSLKTGSGIHTDPAGRTFYLWEKKHLHACMIALGLTVLEEHESDSADGEGKRWIGYVLAAGSAA